MLEKNLFIYTVEKKARGKGDKLFNGAQNRCVLTHGSTQSEQSFIVSFIARALNRDLDFVNTLVHTHTHTQDHRLIRLPFAGSFAWPHSPRLTLSHSHTIYERDRVQNSHFGIDSNPFGAAATSSAAAAAVNNYYYRSIPFIFIAIMDFIWCNFSQNCFYSFVPSYAARFICSAVE